MAGKRLEMRGHTKNPLSIVVLNWNGWETTLKCLKSVFQSKNINPRIILIDNDSMDDSAPRLRRFFSSLYGRVSLKARKTRFDFDFGNDTVSGWAEKIGQHSFICCDRNYGFSGGGNVGIHFGLKNGSSDILLLNNDAVVDPETISTMVRISKTNKSSITGAQSFYPGKKVSFVARRFWPRTLFNFKAPPLYEAETNYWCTDLVEGSIMLLKRDFLEFRFKNCGFYFDPKYFMYCEDSDLSLFAKEHGFARVIASKATICHEASKSTGGLGNIRSHYYIARNTILLARQWSSKSVFLAFVFYYLSSLVIRFPIRLIKRRRIEILRFKTAWSGVFDAFYKRWGKWKFHDQNRLV